MGEDKFASHAKVKFGHLRRPKREPLKCGAPVRIPHVRFGSEADTCSAQGYVRFTPNSDYKSGHWPVPRGRHCLLKGEKLLRYSVRRSAAAHCAALIRFNVTRYRTTVREGVLPFHSDDARPTTAHILNHVQRNGSEHRGSSHELAPYSHLASDRAPEQVSSPARASPAQDDGRRRLLDPGSARRAMSPVMIGLFPVKRTRERLRTLIILL